MYKRLYPKYFEEPTVPNTGFRLQTHEVPTSTKIPIVTQENNSHGDKTRYLQIVTQDVDENS